MGCTPLTRFLFVVGGAVRVFPRPIRGLGAQQSGVDEDGIQGRGTEEGGKGVVREAIRVGWCGMSERQTFLLHSEDRSALCNRLLEK